METMATEVSLYPETAKDALARWDAGDNVFTIEMGGLGPGYEQAIQLCVFEIIRAQGDEPLPDVESMTEEDRSGWFSHWQDEAIDKLDAKCGFSGAQVGAAKQIAFRSLRDGWRKTLESVPGDRLIQVSNRWPTA